MFAVFKANKNGEILGCYGKPQRRGFAAKQSNTKAALKPNRLYLYVLFYYASFCTKILLYAFNNIRNHYTR